MKSNLTKEQIQARRRRVVEMYAAGKTLPVIVRELTNEGVPIDYSMAHYYVFGSARAKAKTARRKATKARAEAQSKEPATGFVQQLAALLSRLFKTPEEKADFIQRLKDAA